MQFLNSNPQLRTHSKSREALTKDPLNEAPQVADVVPGHVLPGGHVGHGEIPGEAGLLGVGFRV